MTKRTTLASIQQPQYDIQAHIEHDIAVSIVDEGGEPITDEGAEPIADEEDEPIADEEDEVIAEEENEAWYDVDWLEHDPGKRIPITDYDVNDRDRVRRRYVALGPCQPRQHDFPRRDVGGMRRFIAGWYDAYPWLEYSVEKMQHFVWFAISSRINLILLVEIAF